MENTSTETARKQEKALRIFFNEVYEVLEYVVLGKGKIKKNTRSRDIKVMSEVEVTESEKQLIIEFFDKAHRLMTYKGLAAMMRFPDGKASLRCETGYVLLMETIAYCVTFNIFQPSRLFEYILDIACAWGMTTSAFEAHVLSMAITNDIKSAKAKSLEKRFPWKSISEAAMLLCVQLRNNDDMTDEAIEKFIDVQLAPMFKKKSKKRKD